MSDFDLEGLINPALDSGRSRKRKRDPTNWAKNVRKFARNSSSAHSKPMVTCSHKHKESKTCKVTHLNENDIKQFVDKLYSKKSKVEQDNFLINYMIAREPKRRRPRTEDPRNRLQTEYFIRKSNGQLLCVCAQTFSSITGISRYRINSISKSFSKTGEARIEQRGGSRRKGKDIEIENSIVRFIGTLQCRESHYGRSKSVRVYMDPSLSVKKVWELWRSNRIEIGQPAASYSKFYKIFQSRFNIGFGNPKTDTCSYCEECKISIKQSKTPSEKAVTTARYRLHKLRAKRFYELLKENNSDTVTVAFDMQQNQPLPMLRVSETFYARQIWLYNLTFIIHEAQQRRENCFIYVWTENQSGRGSNEIVSALRSFLKTLEERVKSHAEQNQCAAPTKLRLFSDSACSQNKNQTMLAFLLNYVQRSEIFKEVYHYFPIRGHSFMPPDRLFGRVEKVYRTKQQILTPEEYYSILEKYGELRILGIHWRVLNYKKCADIITKSVMPFKMREQRVFSYKKNSSLIFVKNTYCGAESGHSIQNKKMVKKWQSVFSAINIVNETNKISDKKKKDVQDLLKFVVLNKEAEAFYHKALQNITDQVDVVDHEIVQYDDDEPFL